MFKRSAFAIAALVAATVPAFAGETVSYRYDAKGRLVRVERTGSVNNGVTTTYSRDRADNRTAKQTTGAP